MDQNTREFLEGLGELPEVDPALYDVEQILVEFGGGPALPETSAEDLPAKTPPAEEETQPADRPLPEAVSSDSEAPPELSKEAEKPAETPAEEPLQREEALPDFSLENVVSGTVSTVV